MYFFRQQIDLKTEVGGRIFHNIYFEGGRLRDKERELELEIVFLFY